MSNPKAQTVDSVINRMHAILGSVADVKASLANITEALTGLEVTRSQQAQLDRALVEVRAATEGCDGLTNYYSNQINNLTNLQQTRLSQATAEAAAAMPEVSQDQQPASQLPEMIDPSNAPRPGSAAWRILQRQDPERARQLLDFNPEPTPAAVETQPAAAPVQPNPVDGPYDRMTPSYTAKPELTPEASTTRRSSVVRPTRPVALQPGAAAPASHSAPQVDIGGLPAPVAAQPEPSKLPDPVPREPSAIPTLQTPPTGYQRLTMPKYSPLYRAFAPAPWLEEGTGTITVGTKGWPEITADIYGKNNFDLVRSEQAFYRTEGDDHPSSVLIRLRTFAVLWNFGNEPGDILVYQVGMSDAGSNDHRWFPAHTLPSSSVLRLLGELNTYFGTKEVPFNPAAPV